MREGERGGAARTACRGAALTSAAADSHRLLIGLMRRTVPSYAPHCAAPASLTSARRSQLSLPSLPRQRRRRSPRRLVRPPTHRRSASSTLPRAPCGLRDRREGPAAAQSAYRESQPSDAAAGRRHARARASLPAGLPPTQTAPQGAPAWPRWARTSTGGALEGDARRRDAQEAAARARASPAAAARGWRGACGALLGAGRAADEAAHACQRRLPTVGA